MNKEKKPDSIEIVFTLVTAISGIITLVLWLQAIWIWEHPLSMQLSLTGIITFVVSIISLIIIGSGE